MKTFESIKQPFQLYLKLKEIRHAPIKYYRISLKELNDYTSAM